MLNVSEASCEALAELMSACCLQVFLVVILMRYVNGAIGWYLVGLAHVSFTVRGHCSNLAALCLNRSTFKDGQPPVCI